MRNIVILAVLSAALAVALGGLALKDRDVGPAKATLLPQPLALPDFALLDQRGAPFGRSGFGGRWNLVFFGFTHCPDVCPITLQQLAVARRRLADRLPESKLPRVVFVSVDPGRDDVDTVAAYTEAFDTEIVGLTGRLDEIDVLAGALGIFHSRTESGEDDRGSYSVDHSAAVVVVDADGNYRAVFSAPHDVESFVDDMLYMIERT